MLDTFFYIAVSIIAIAFTLACMIDRKAAKRETVNTASNRK